MKTLAIEALNLEIAKSKVEIENREEKIVEYQEHIEACKGGIEKQRRILESCEEALIELQRLGG